MTKSASFGSGDWLAKRKATEQKLQHAGVWSPDQEHDACGVGFVASVDGSDAGQWSMRLLKRCSLSGTVVRLMQMA